MFQSTHFHLSKTPTNISTAITETLVLTLLGIILGVWFTPEVSFFSVPGFSWLLIGPFFSGLRYGFVYAFNSALFLIGLMWLSSYQLGIWSSDSFFSTTLALLFIAIGTGEFRNYWQRKLDKLQASSEYLDHRLDEVTNAFNLIKISHDKLVQRTASRNTLRDSILSVRTHIMKAQLTNSDLASLSTSILRIYADYCAIQQAGLYAVNSGKLNLSALAFFGGQFEVNIEDKVLQKALVNQSTTSLKPELVTNDKYTNLLLLAIPLVDVFGKLRALILVNQMSFRAFRDDNIRLAAILGGHIADLISMRSDSESFKDINLQLFISQLKRCMQDVTSFGISGSLICLQTNNIQYGKNINTLVIGQRRGLDSVWSLQNSKGVYCAFILLPLTDLLGVDNYKIRLQQMIQESYGYKTLEDAGITLLKRDLATNKTAKALMLELFQQVE